jgi:putative endonuclease
MKTLKRKIGDIGERMTCKYLEILGYRIIERNYLRKWGEVDIIAEQGRILFFIEVKTITKRSLNLYNQGNYRPEENVSYSKRIKLRRTVQIYLIENNIVQIPWKFLVASVNLKEGSEQQSDISLFEEIL